jgi:hypothetical protein
VPIPASRPMTPANDMRQRSRIMAICNASGGTGVSSIYRDRTHPPHLRCRIIPYFDQGGAAARHRWRARHRAPRWDARPARARRRWSAPTDQSRSPVRPTGATPSRLPRSRLSSSWLPSLSVRVIARHGCAHLRPATVTTSLIPMRKRETARESDGGLVRTRIIL